MKCEHEGCKKKINAINVVLKCRCDKSFCVIHRLPEYHNCQSDYRKFNKEEFIENNKCVAKQVIY
jgi:hypothetical protein